MALPQRIESHKIRIYGIALGHTKTTGDMNTEISVTKRRAFLMHYNITTGSSRDILFNPHISSHEIVSEKST